MCNTILHTTDDGIANIHKDDCGILKINNKQVRYKVKEVIIGKDPSVVTCLIDLPARILNGVRMDTDGR